MITADRFKQTRCQREGIEKAIDYAIEGAASSGSRIVTVQLKRGWDLDKLEEVLAKYRAHGGWIAEIILDSRDGDFIKLEPRIM